MLSRVKHETSSITSGPGHVAHCFVFVVGFVSDCACPFLYNNMLKSALMS